MSLVFTGRFALILAVTLVANLVMAIEPPPSKEQKAAIERLDALKIKPFDVSRIIIPKSTKWQTFKDMDLTYRLSPLGNDHYKSVIDAVGDYASAKKDLSDLEARLGVAKLGLKFKERSAAFKNGASSEADLFAARLEIEGLEKRLPGAKRDLQSATERLHAQLLRVLPKLTIQRMIAVLDGMQKSVLNSTSEVHEFLVQNPRLLSKAPRTANKGALRSKDLPAEAEEVSAGGSIK